MNVSGDMQLKWIGKGFSEKIIDCEMLLSQTMLADSSITSSDYDGRFRLKTTTGLLSVFFRPVKTLTLKLSMPFLYKQGPDGKTGPFGDLSLDVSGSWGALNRGFAGLTIGFPTGYSSIMKDNMSFLSLENQLGSGLFGASARAGYSFSPEWGILNIGASYSAGLFAIRTSEYGYDQNTDLIIYDKKTFELARNGFGARNDAGVTRPDFLGVFADLGIKTETVNHGISVGYYYPAAPVTYETLVKANTTTTFATRALAQAYLDAGDTVANVKSFAAGQRTDSTWEYVTRTTLTRKTFPSLTLQYNIEKNDLAFPIFLGGMVKLDYNNRLNFGGFGLGLGFKFPVY
jgi:hypothetical protein